MGNKHDESKKIILGLLIGGAVGAGALYFLRAAQKEKTPLLKKIGKTMVDVGEMLEDCDMSSGADVIESIEKKIPSGAKVFDHLVSWAEMGLALWKKFKKE